MELYVIRHGRVPSNDLGIISGSNDEQLTDVGVKQAESMRERLKNLDFDALYSSNVKRAIQTAEIVNSWGLEINLDKRLAEREPGSLIGKSRKEIDKRLWNSLEVDRTPEGAETLKAGLIRTKKFLGMICDKYQDGRVLIVTHNFICKCIWMLIEEIDDFDEIDRFVQANDEVRKYVKVLK